MQLSWGQVHASPPDQKAGGPVGAAHRLQGAGSEARSHASQPQQAGLQMISPESGSRIDGLKCDLVAERLEPPHEATLDGLPVAFINVAPAQLLVASTALQHLNSSPGE